MKQTKRIMAFLLALLLTVTMLPMYVFAAETPTFTVSSASGKAGDEITLQVDISNNPGFFAATWTVSYDETRLDKVEYVMEEIDGVMLSNENNNFLWENTVMDNIKYDGKVLDLKFRIKENAPAGDAEVTITKLLAGTVDSDAVKFDVVAGKVSVAAEKLETLIPFTKANQTDSGDPIHSKYEGIVGLKVEGIKIANWTEWKQGVNYQSQEINIFVDPASKNDSATLSLILKEGQAGSGSIIDAPATVELKDGKGSYTASYMTIGTGGLAPKLHITINFKPACTEHSWDDATCEAPKTCSVCGATDGEALGHDWADATYNWEENGSACTATRTCNNNGDHKESATATVTSKVTKKATCTAKGETTYTAKFAENWAVEQTKTIEDIDTTAHVYDKIVAEEKYLESAATCTEEAVYYKSCVCGEAGTETFTYGEALGHDWNEAEYKWAEDGSSCEATRICKRGNSHKETATATEIKSEVAKPATCITKGDTRYEAIFDEDWAHDYKAITDIPVDENAHEWGEWKVVKEATYTEKGTEKRICNLSDEHFEEKEIKILIPTATEKVEPSEDGKEYVVAYQEGVVIVPEGLDVTAEDIKDALTNKVEDGSLKGEVVVTFMEATIGYFDDNNNFVPVESEDFFKDGKTIDITLAYPEGADKNDNFEVYHYIDEDNIEKCTIKSRTEKGLVIEVNHLSPFAIAYVSVDDAPNQPSKPSKSDKEVITIVVPKDEAEESNPNTGAPVLCSFNLTAAGIVVFAATTAVLEIKRRK